MASWTYVDPSATSKDAVRLLTGQTSSGDEVLLYDEEITYALNNRDTTDAAAAWCLEMLASRYATFPASKQVGQLGITYHERANQLRKSAAVLRTAAALGSFTPFVGGTSVADKKARQQDTDRVTPAFERGQFDNPDAGDPVSQASTAS